jgi:hypothetical protein
MILLQDSDFDESVINISPSMNDNEASNDSGDIWTHHKDLLNQQNVTGGSGNSNEELKNIIDRECSQYLNAPFAKLNDQPFKVWDDLKVFFPHLHKVAKRFLVIPGTSVPSERLFSEAGHILTDFRNRLKGDRVKKIFFLHSLETKDWL